MSGTRLDRYVQLTGLRSYVVVSTALTALFSLFGFVEQLGDLGDGTYGLRSALAVVLLSTPYRLLQVSPVSMLLASLLALSTLSRGSELTALRSLGVSKTRIAGSIARLLVPIVAALFLLSEFVIPPAQRLAQDIRAAGLSSAKAGDDFWAHDGHQYLNVQRFVGRSAAQGVEIYRFQDDGELDNFVAAKRAEIRPDGTWLLTDVTRKTLVASEIRTDTPRTLSWPAIVSMKEVRFLTLPTGSMPPVELYRFIRRHRARGDAIAALEQELWARISLPVSMLAMVVIAFPFVFGAGRTENTGFRLSIGAAIGIAFALSQQLARHFGLLYDWDPAATSLMPSAVLMIVAIALSSRSSG